MFCRICGNEVNDEAIVCPKCGCLVKAEFKVEPKKEKKVNPEEVKKSLEKKLTIFTILAFCIGMFASFITLAGAGGFGIFISFCNIALGVLSLIYAIKNKTNTPLFIIGVVAFSFTIFNLLFNCGLEELVFYCY